MSNNVDITFAANGKSAEQALDKMNERLRKTEAQLDKLRNVSKQSASAGKQGFDAQSSAIGRTLLKLGSAAASYLSLQMAIRAVGNEFQETARKQRAFLDATLAPSEAITQLKNNFVPDPTLSRAKFEDAVFALSKEISQPITPLSQTLGAVLSAKGPLTAEEGFNLVRQTAKLEVFDPDFNKEIAKSAGDIAKNQKIRDPRVLLGSLLNIQAAIEGSNPADLGKNLLPGVIGLSKGFGDSFEESAELGAAITQLSLDPSGETTATALPTFGEGIQQFVPQRQKKGKFRKQFTGEDQYGEFAIPDAQVEAFERAKKQSTTAAIKVLQESPELLRGFEGEFKGLRAKVRQPFLRILRKEKEAMDALETARNIIKPLDEGQISLFDEQVKFNQGGRLSAISRAQRKSAVEKEQALLGNSINQRIAFARTKFEETLDLVDLPGLDGPQKAAVRLGLEKKFKKVASEGGIPELEAAKALEVFPRKAGKFSLFSNDLTPEEVKDLEDGISRLKEEGATRGSIKPAFQRAGESPDGLIDVVPDRPKTQMEFEQRRAQTRLDRASNVGDDIEMKKQTAILADISRKMDAQNSPPRQTEPRASRLSRGAR